MDGCLGNEYKLDTSDNFLEYMKFLEVGFYLQKFGLIVKPVASLLKNADGTYTFQMYTSAKSTWTTFIPGKEFVEERFDGVKVWSTITLEGNKLTQVQVEQNGRTSTHVREFTPETLTVVTTGDNWDYKCVRVYKRVVGQISGI